MERTTIGRLDAGLVPEPIDVLTLDECDQVGIRGEPGLEHPPRSRADRRRAVAWAEEGLRSAGWMPLGAIRSPLPGSRGGIEDLVHARRHVDHPATGSSDGRRRTPP